MTFPSVISPPVCGLFVVPHHAGSVVTWRVVIAA